jgi:hypothetical protein
VAVGRPLGARVVDCDVAQRLVVMHVLVQTSTRLSWSQCFQSVNKEVQKTWTKYGSG